MKAIKYTIIGISLGLGILSSVSAQYYNSYTPLSGGVCTMDAYTCPNGTTVGRTGTNCQFVCPSTQSSTQNSYTYTIGCTIYYYNGMTRQTTTIGLSCSQNNNQYYNNNYNYSYSQPYVYTQPTSYYIAPTYTYPQSSSQTYYYTTPSAYTQPNYYYTPPTSYDYGYNYGYGSSYYPYSYNQGYYGDGITNYYGNYGSYYGNNYNNTYGSNYGGYSNGYNYGNNNYYSTSGCYYQGGYQVCY